MRRPRLVIAGAGLVLLAAMAGPATEGARLPEPGGPQETNDEASGGRLHVRWMAWGRESFEIAASLKRPVLLYLRAADCRLCLHLERDVLDEPEVVKLIADQVVPIAVDVDLRPDIASRYVIRAVPTISYLLPNGEPMYRIEKSSSLERVGAYMTNPDRFRRYLGVAVRYMKEHPVPLLNKAREVAALEAKVRDLAPGEPPLNRLDELRMRIRDRIDYTHGGFGRGWKTIDDAPFRLFRVLSAGRIDDPLAKATLNTARRILATEIHDPVEGGFHHYATQRDWSVPALEKRLDVNARALRLLVAASALAPEDKTLREGAASTAGFLLDHLALPEGGFALGQHGSLGPDDPGTYFTLDAAGRQTRRPPPVEPRFITEYNAGAAVALLEAGALLGRDDLEAAGLRTVDVLVRRVYRKGRGLARTVSSSDEAQIAGLLVDQVSVLEALLAAYEVRGDPGDLERARAVASFCRANLRREAGHYVDRTADRAAVGKMKRPVVDLAANGRIALALIRLAALTGDPSPREEAAAVLGALGGVAVHMTEREAPFVEALLALQRQPVRLVVFGPPEVPEVLALRRAAQQLPEVGAVVVPVAPGSSTPVGPGWPPAPEREAGTAWVCAGERCRGPVREVTGLRPALEAARGATD